MRDTVIYGMKGPDDDTIWYVGKTHKGIEFRLKEHLADAKHGTSKKCKWIRSLIEQGKKPLIIIIEVCDHEVWPQREQYWIKFYRASNPGLTNSPVIRLSPDKKNSNELRGVGVWLVTQRRIKLIGHLTEKPHVQVMDEMSIRMLEEIKAAHPEYAERIDRELPQSDVIPASNVIES